MEAELLEYLPKDLITHIIEPYCVISVHDYDIRYKLRQVQPIAQHMQWIGDSSLKYMFESNYREYYPLYNDTEFETMLIGVFRKTVLELAATRRKYERLEREKQNLQV
jgi:hypothetical protein